MKTFNRPFAPTPGIEADVMALCEIVRGLWCREPQTDGADREAVIVELQRVELDLQRLALRIASGPESHGDVGLLDDCRARVESLRRCWPEDRILCSS